MIAKCPECGTELTKEMIDANMCWECGKILDESLLDESTIMEIHLQEEKENPFLKAEIKQHKLTTGYEFSDYKINSYNGLVSGEVVVGTGFASDFKAGVADFFGTELSSYSEKIKGAKQAVLFDMINDSIKKGGNAIIGISYSYIPFAGNMIGISVNGTSVTTEVIE